MKRHRFSAIATFFTILILVLNILASEKKENTMKSDKTTEIADYNTIPFKTITGDTTSLAAFDGKVKLLVNVASKCGFTLQYEGLEALYQKYRDQGLVIIGFPANNFGDQEPGTNEEILTFCKTKFDVSFPMMAKISVKGNDQHPLYEYLTEKSRYSGEITWNFNKFLLDKNGNVVARYPSKVKPLDQELVSKIENLL